jgi:hypothetical protein
MLASEEPERLAHLEPYLLDVVGAHFRRTGELSPEDFWLILVWKANRAKNHQRRRLERNGGTYREAVAAIARQLRGANAAPERLGTLMTTWGMRLPTASAVLTVLYPEEFTVYDIRVCDQLGDFHALVHRPFSAKLWADFCLFKEAVQRATPKKLTLRQKDHYLWGKSLMEQVRADLAAPVPAPRGRYRKT